MRSVVIFALVFGCMCTAQDSPLGDVARQQKAVSRPAARRVIDNENLPHASAAEGRNGAVVMPKSSQAKAEENPSQTKVTPAAVPAIPADAQKRLDDLKATAEAQQRAMKKFEEELKDESVSLERRQMFEDGLSTAKQALDQVMKEIAGVAQSVKSAEQSAQPEDANAKTEDLRAKPDEPNGKPDEAVAPQHNEADGPQHNEAGTPQQSTAGEKGNDSKAPEKSADNKDGN